MGMRQAGMGAGRRTSEQASKHASRAGVPCLPDKANKVKQTGPAAEEGHVMVPIRGKMARWLARNMALKSADTHAAEGRVWHRWHR